MNMNERLLTELTETHGTSMVVLSEGDWDAIRDLIKSRAPATYQKLKELDIKMSPMRVSGVETVSAGATCACGDVARVVESGVNCCHRAKCRLPAAMGEVVAPDDDYVDDDYVKPQVSYKAMRQFHGLPS